MKGLRELPNSRRAIVAIAASVLAYIGFRAGLPKEQVGYIVSPLLLFIATQGAADWGKERVRLDYDRAESARKAYQDSASSDCDGGEESK